MNTIIKRLLFSLLLVFIFILTIKTSNLDAYTVKEDKENYPPCYQQADIRWRLFKHGGETMGDNACGILSTVNAVNYLTGNFINPKELADYAYSIDAYNGTIGGGTARYVLYCNLDPFEEKYGFEVTTPSVEGGVSRKELKEHLLSGGVAICLVYGHFIALCGYDATDDTYLVYDSAANVNRRHTYPFATWLSSSELTYNESTNEGNFYMDIKWFCLLTKTADGYSYLDGENKKGSNGKAEASFTINKNVNNYQLISGYATDTRGIKGYHYVLDYDFSNPLPLSCYKRSDIDLTNYPLCSLDFTGFKGSIDVSGLEVGTHYINVYADTLDNGLSSVANIKLYVTDHDFINTDEKTYTVTMDMCNKQDNVVLGFAGYNKYLFTGNYNAIISIGDFDLTKFKKAEIYYSTDQSYKASLDGTESLIGLIPYQIPFGYTGTPFANYAVASAKMTDGTSSGWSTFRKAELDLSNVNYSGELFVNAYNQESQLYVIEKIVFTYNDDIDLIKENYELDDADYEKLITIKPKTSLFDEQNSLFLGNYDLNDISVLNIKFKDKMPNNFNIVLKNNSAKINTSNKNRFYGLIVSRYQENYDSYAFALDLKDVNYCGPLYLVTDSAQSLTIDSVELYNKDIASPFYKTKDIDIHASLIGIYEENAIYVDSDHVIYSDYLAPTCTNEGHDYSYCICCNHYLKNEVLKPLGHTESEYYYDDEGHFFTCDTCFQTYDRENHEFGSWQFNSINHYLECVCGYRKDVNRHKFNGYEITKEGHYQVCECGYESKIVAHKYDEVTHLCICGAKDDSICDHKNIVIDEKIEPTCLEDGLTEGSHCKDCGAVIVERKTISKLGHNFVGNVCTRCNYKKSGCKKNNLSILSLLNLASIGMLFLYLRKNK